MNAKKNRPRKWPVYLVFIVATAAPTAALLFHTWCHIQVVRMGYELSDALEQQSRLLEENRRLNIELETLRAPDWLHRYASKLGLRPPAAEQLRNVKRGEAVKQR